jgi:hypothetical protein
MIVTKRTKFSLCQFLGLFDQDFLHVLLEKHGITAWGYSQTEISEVLSEADQGLIEPLIDEVVRTNGDLRNRVSPRYRFDERWSDFEKCLLLDGFKIQEKEIVTIEPVIEGAQPLEDDLTNELEASGLPSTDDIIRLIRLSAESFRKSTPDYNACLTHARVALETIVRTIARLHGLEIEQDSKAWGKSLSHIKSSGFVTNKEEAAIASTYTFISDGAHVPVGFTEEEFTRFGRNLSMSVCYFIIKKSNGQCH